MADIASSIYRAFLPWGLAGIFVSMFIESFGLPFPIEFAYLAAIAMVASRRESFAVIIFVLAAGQIAGAFAGYSIGRKSDSWMHRRLAASERFRDIHERLRSWYQRYGILTVFGARFVGYVRPFASIIAGIAEFPAKPFLIWTSLGALLFNVIAFYAAWTLLALWKKYTVLHFAIVVALSLSFLTIFFYELLRRKRHARKNEPVS